MISVLAFVCLFFFGVLLLSSWNCVDNRAGLTLYGPLAFSFSSFLSSELDKWWLFLFYLKAQFVKKRNSLGEFSPHAVRELKKLHGPKS